MSKVDSKKNDILNVAQNMFATKGFEATTTREISKAAGISDGSLYYHFPDGKKEILDTIVDTGTLRHVEMLNRKFPDIQSIDDLLNQLKVFQTKISHFFDDEDNYQTFLITIRERNIISNKQSKWLTGIIDSNISNLVSGLSNIPELAEFDSTELNDIAEILISVVQKSIYDELIIRNHRHIDREVQKKVSDRLKLLLRFISSSRPKQ
jgi:AcrR family transcriptional regulator